MSDNTPATSSVVQGEARAPYAPPHLESAPQTLTTLLASGAGEDCDPSPPEGEPTPAE